MGKSNLFFEISIFRQNENLNNLQLFNNLFVLIREVIISSFKNKKSKLTRLLFTILLLLLLFNNAIGQTYSLSFKDTPLREILRGIEREGDYRFFFSDDAVDLSQRTDIHISNASIEQILEALLPQFNLTFQKTENNLIIITPYINQEVVVTGTVMSANGETLPGVNVVIKGTTTGTVTNLNGAFSILAPNQNATLIFSFIGYDTKEIIIDNRNIINVILKEDHFRLDEIVVTALGILRSQKALSYNVQEVKGEELLKVKNTNFVNSITGKVAGLQINPGAGGNGAASNVVMRGVKSLSKSNNVLYVIDGIPMNNSLTGNKTDVGYFSGQQGTETIADINPEDIESISMLSGPSAAALYGYQGANGVILITTKKGRSDKTVVTAGNSATFSTPMMLPDFQNRYGNMPGEFESWGDEIKDYKGVTPSDFFRLGTNIMNNFSIETGSEKNQTYFSAASLNSTGIMPNNFYNRYNFKIRNTAFFLNDKLVLDVGANYIIQKDRNMVSQGQYFNPLPALYLFPRGEDFNKIRNFEIYNEATGTYSQFWEYDDQGLSLQNPYWIMNRMNRDWDKKRYIFSIGLQYNIADWMNVTGRVRSDNNDMRHTEKRYAGTSATFSGTKGYYRLENRQEQLFYGDIIANINPAAFGGGRWKSKIDFGASIKDLSRKSHYIGGDLDKITNWFTTENISRTSAFKVNDDGLKQQTQSLFASVETGYKSMIFLTVTGRNDWDSALAFSEGGRKSFFYPSVGLSAIVSDMFRFPRWFSYLKVRGSYTSVGMAYEPYITRERFEYDEQTNQYNIQPLYPNRNLKPELTKSCEAGLDMRLLNGVIGIDFTWYKSNTLNQTFIAELPPSSFYSGVYVQGGDVQNSGIELLVDFKSPYFGGGRGRWYSSFTYSFNRNIINKLANGIKNPVNGDIISMPYLNMATLGNVGSPILRLVEGGSMGDIYATRELQRDDNGIILLNELLLPEMVHSDYKKIGSVLPDYFLGWMNTISWNGFDFNFLLSGRFGGKVVSNTQAILDRYGVSKYSAKLRDDGGIIIRGENISARDYLNVIASGTGQGAHYVYNATNVRLSEASVNYTIQTKWRGEISVGIFGNNIFMIYCKAPFDPELAASSTNTYYTAVDYFMQPALRSWGVSLRVKLGIRNYEL